MAHRVYIACSLDGFIAGPDHDLSWLPTDPVDDPEDGVVTYEAFTAEIGAMLMGRATFDVVHSFDGSWPYGQTPVLVATTRPLPADAPDSVTPASGDIEALSARAQEMAGTQDVYVDGGAIIRQALDAGLLSELIVTFIPTILGRGQSLFAGTTSRHALKLVASHRYGDRMVQLRLIPG